MAKKKGKTSQDMANEMTCCITKKRNFMPPVIKDKGNISSLKEGETINLRKIKNGIMMRKSGGEENGWKDTEVFCATPNDVVKHL